jgi:hypothetical protein
MWLWWMKKEIYSEFWWANLLENDYSLSGTSRSTWENNKKAILEKRYCEHGTFGTTEDSVQSHTLALSNVWIIKHHTFSHVAEWSALAKFKLNKQVRGKLVQCPYLVDKRPDSFSCNDRSSNQISLCKLQHKNICRYFMGVTEILVIISNVNIIFKKFCL